MFSRKIFYAALILAFVKKDESARILAYFPVPSISHQVVFRPLTQELAKRGHELIILTPDPAFPSSKTPPNITEINLHDESYKMWEQSFVKSIDGKTSAFDALKIGFKIITDIVEKDIHKTVVQEIMKKEKFDLLLLEACVRPALVMSYIFKAPVIQVSSFGAVVPNYAVHGAPYHPLLYPMLFRKRIYNLTTWEKIIYTYEDIKMHYLLWSLEKSENEMIKRNFGPNAPTVDVLNNNVDMLFLNIHPIWEGNRPVPPGIIHMGGLHTHSKLAKELPKDLRNYLDSSPNGVIYMSLGTNVQPSLLPPEIIQIFLRVFTKLPYNILLKWDKEELANKPKNVKLFKWVPQSDLLRHPKIRLFITQAGLQSTDEAINSGIPLIAFPMLADQWYNAEKIVHHKIGKQLDIETISEEILENSIDTVINDERYRQNVMKLRSVMNDQPQSALERAVWWTEHVLRHGGARHLRAPAANISWSEYLALDLLITLTIVSLIVIYILFKIIMFLITLLPTTIFYDVKIKTK